MVSGQLSMGFIAMSIPSDGSACHSQGVPCVRYKTRAVPDMTNEMITAMPGEGVTAAAGQKLNVQCSSLNNIERPVPPHLPTLR
jgi:hypothetical protein